VSNKQLHLIFRERFIIKEICKMEKSIFPVRGKVLTINEIKERVKVIEDLDKILGSDKMIVICDSEESKSPIEKLMEKFYKCYIAPSADSKLEKVNENKIELTKENVTEVKEKLEKFFSDSHFNIDSMQDIDFSSTGRMEFKFLNEENDLQMISIKEDGMYLRLIMSGGSVWNLVIGEDNLIFKDNVLYTWIKNKHLALTNGICFIRIANKKEKTIVINGK
jgi:hypothetical protein